jgi:hypothetical protein
MLVVGATLMLVAWREQQTTQARATETAGAPGVVTVSAGSRDLAWDEQQGGHTLTRHVGKSDRELALRLEREAGVAAASSFTDRATAERVVGRALQREKGRVASWMRRSKDNLTLDYRGEPGNAVGRVLLRGETRPLEASDARVVLRKRGDRYFVLTSYPVEP